eukprot:CAMPEP_0170462212 /NCGR_PEP_ID=MMETSP0123-20130129/7803_1 /TAXON_ID=182087 /ORGANISM="Favella ehrenbergii, Strain Fehren 1" /LENGTH=60 /DNA_ID=CAMNT_0010727377 /DNA_START=27 /DNA_END=209 /DNA_ORIENTATION=-
MAQANKYRVGGRGGGATDDEMQIDDMSRERQVPSLMPTGDEMFRLLKSMDMSYKTEMVFY